MQMKNGIWARYVSSLARTLVLSNRPINMNQTSRDSKIPESITREF